MKIITDKELILLKAEVLWGQGQYPQALTLSNFIRTNNGGLSPSGASGAASAQRNSEAEAVLAAVGKSRPLAQCTAVWEAQRHRTAGWRGTGARIRSTANFPIPFNESSARSGDLTQQCSSAG